MEKEACAIELFGTVVGQTSEFAKTSPVESKSKSNFPPIPKRSVASSFYSDGNILLVRVFSFPESFPFAEHSTRSDGSAFSSIIAI